MAEFGFSGRAIQFSIQDISSAGKSLLLFSRSDKVMGFMNAPRLALIHVLSISLASGLKARLVCVHAWSDYRRILRDHKRLLGNRHNPSY